VLLIAGSGAADRDETIFAHKPFLVLADHLTRKGIAVLRVDKRGIGRTTGTFRGSGIKDFASDALAGVQYLKTRPEVDGKKIGLVGHSEGGATASVVAAQTRDVSYVVLLGSMGMSGYDILVLQDGTEARAAGKSDEEIALIRGYSRRFYSIILEETERTAIEERTKKLQDSLTEAEKKALGWPNLGGSQPQLGTQSCSPGDAPVRHLPDSPECFVPGPRSQRQQGQPGPAKGESRRHCAGTESRRKPERHHS
jgi:hypothetical protein